MAWRLNHTVKSPYLIVLLCQISFISTRSSHCLLCRTRPWCIFLVFLPIGLFSPLFTFTAFPNCMQLVIVQLSKCQRHLKLIASEQRRERSSTFLIRKCSAHTGDCPCIISCFTVPYCLSWAHILSFLLFYCLIQWRGLRVVSPAEPKGQNLDSTMELLAIDSSSPQMWEKRNGARQYLHSGVSQGKAAICIAMSWNTCVCAFSATHWPFVDVLQ